MVKWILDSRKLKQYNICRPGMKKGPAVELLIDSLYILELHIYIFTIDNRMGINHQSSSKYTKSSLKLPNWHCDNRLKQVKMAK